MKPHGGIISGPSLYRHECRTCGEETLHNARGCVRCQTLPWAKPIKVAGNAHRVLTAKARKRRARW